ncbi:MAG: tetratricopeptide repeat protein [Actinobacteria bacterium]|nr:MAG: tetratricopeptide repeat protein [Actinomycetota bacterium]
MKLRLNTHALDIAVKVVGLLVVVALVYLGYTVWSTQRSVEQNSVTGRAIQTLVEQVKKSPRDANARVLLAQALASAGRLDDSVEQFQNALKIEKDNAAALEGLGLIAMKREEWRTAEGYWQRLVDSLKSAQFSNQDQRLERAYYYRGVTLISLKEYEDAVLYLKEALRMKRDDADTHYALSVAYRELDSSANQRKELETALAFVPTMAEANYDMGLLLLADGDRAGAAELFRRSADNAPGRAEPMKELEKFGPMQPYLDKAKSLKTTDAKAALIEARIAIALDPSSVEAARLVAVLLEDVGTKDEAVAAYERVLQLVPQDPEATEALARLGK